MSFRKISMSFGTPMPEGKEVSDECMKHIIQENRWRPGVILLNGHRLDGFRKSNLGGWTYRIGTQELAQVDAFNPTEYQDWRDA